MLNQGVAEREKSHPFRRLSGTSIVPSKNRSEEIKAEIARKNEAYLKKRREALETAKQSRTKKPLDVGRYFRAFLRSSNEAEIQRLMSDPREVERVEFQYYVMSPKEIKTFEQFMDWILTQL